MSRYDLTQIETGEPALHREPTVFQGLLEAAAASLRPLASGKGLHLLVTTPGEDVMAWTDRRLFSQIVLSLLRNAIKFTAQGSVHLSLGLRTIDGKKMVEIVVADTGAGISPGDQARLFSALPQAPACALVGETGLGLPFVQKLAAMLGGKIGLHSEPGKGSTFTLQLPRS